MWLVLALLVLFACPVMAQPADCAPARSADGLAADGFAADGLVLPLAIDVAGRPGVPKGVRGQIYVGVPLGATASTAANQAGTWTAGNGSRGNAPTGSAPTGYACADDRPPPHDVLRGEPSNVLDGPPSPDLLRGPGHPHVEVEIR
jgi:hypothetical protein